MSKNAPVDESSSKFSGLTPGKLDPAAGESSTKSLADVLSALPAPPGGLKRKHGSDEPSAFRPPSKVLRPGTFLSLHHKVSHS